MKRGVQSTHKNRKAYTTRSTISMWVDTLTYISRCLFTLHEGTDWRRIGHPDTVFCPEGKFQNEITTCPQPPFMAKKQRICNWVNTKFSHSKGYVFPIVNEIPSNLRQTFAWKSRRSKIECQRNSHRVRGKGPIRNTDRIWTMSFPPKHTHAHSAESAIHSFVRSYFDVIKWKPYKNWVAPVTSSHIARRRVIIHSLLCFASFSVSLSFFIERVILEKKCVAEEAATRHIQLTNR